MNVLKRLSIRSKLFLISVIPSLGLVYFLQGSISDALDNKNATQRVYDETAQVERISDLIHQFQRERGLILSYTASRQEGDRLKIREQELLTDQSLASVADLYKPAERNPVIIPLLDSLPILRRDLQQYPDHLNRIKSILLGEISLVSRSSQDVEIKNQLQSHVFLLYTKEYFSRTRNVLLPSLIDKTFAQGAYASFSARKGQYELSREEFLNSASPDLADLFRKTISDPSIKNTHLIIDSIFRYPDHVKNVDPDQWWEDASLIVNKLEQLEKHSLQEIKDKAATRLAAINQQVTFNVLLGLLVLVLITILVSLTIRQIIQAITELRNAAIKLSLGDIDFKVDDSSRDELGGLAASFNKMVEVKKVHAHAAEKIGKGNYDVPIVLRGPNDVLSISLTNMRNDLQRLSKENEVRTWLLSGNNILNDSMRGDKALSDLANDVISQLTQYVNGTVGALYIRQNGHLKLSGSYAFDLNKHDITFQLGQGLVGQAAADGRHNVVTEIPDNYLTIKSGLGQSKPKNIMVFPFKYEGEIKGVAEIGATKEFSDLDLEFLNLVSNNIGIAINASESREKLKELLEETQRQSEELETQQEELRQFNEELLEKTHLLEKSEEELKTQQEELQLSNEELVEKAAMLEEQKENLEFTKLQMEGKAKELALASQYKTEFLSNMSHELRTPLNSILILAQVLVENRGKTLSSKEMKFASTIYNSGNDLLSLINEILDLSKIEAGKMELEVKSFSMDLIAQNINNSFEELARSKKIKFAIRCPEELASKVLISDHQRIEQILKNFLSNAFKFTAQGGKIELVIDRPEPGTTFRKKSLSSNQDVLSFSVSDTGIGIPHEKLGIIFEAFQQVDGSTKRQYGGTGLGLSISRELANLLGGEIHVKSQVDVGSSFTIYLPSELQATVPDATEATLTIHPTAPVLATMPPLQDHFPVHDASHYDDQHLITDGDRKILIMEDDVEFSKVLLEFVHERNYKGIIAHQGNIGLSYARHYKPDAIILDMRLPVVDGAEVLKKLKSDPELRHIPVQIISGYDFRKSSLELGAIDFIQKPVSRESFWKALDKVEHFVSRKPKKLLVIEDDQQHNHAVKELIGNGDVKCYSAYSGKEAYKLMSETSFDCIIVDLGLPDMTGFSFLEKIRENADLNRIPVIVYTGKDLSKEENARLEKLANTVVLKTAYSHERLLDETTLFLHRVESKLPKEKQNIIRKLHKTDEVLKNKRVLIVDDDDRNVYSLLHALEQEGLKCFTAGNGKEALKLLEKESGIDLVLMDVMMPEMDGFEATKAIRKIPEFRKMPIIALTAKAMKDDREKCLAAGMSDYISKPLNVQQLLSLMRVWLYG